ncbi:hypothetical protein E2C01_086113 [Portunus trituberculatus]|uniref:Uncharacterized protein n=1 Tax=Portunus trituberculatus TaxID=210409 RepID=A0A5B7JDR1_PORTR|nr:hypothetical protein [Portunus trituberculatus]
MLYCMPLWFRYMMRTRQSGWWRWCRLRVSMPATASWMTVPGTPSCHACRHSRWMAPCLPASTIAGITIIARVSGSPLSRIRYYPKLPPSIFKSTA